jgi:D-glycero-alpha-D-manno-heptose 1-phosphate guanylyltransferase
VNNNATLILAGGLGTRLRSVDGGLPKPMVEILGHPFLYWLIKHLTGFGYKDFTMSLGYKGKDIQSFNWKENFPQCQFSFIHEDKPLGTGGAVKNFFILKPEVQWAWIINGDTLLEEPPPFMPCPVGASVVYSGLEAKNVFDALPNLVVEGDRVRDVSDSKGTVFDGGHVFISRKAVDSYKDGLPCPFHKLIEGSLKLGEVKVHLSKGTCYDIGTPTRLNRFESYIKGKG